MFKKLTWLVIAATLPISALADESSATQALGFLGFYYVPKADLKLSDDTNTLNFDGGKGFGLKGLFPIGPNAFVQGEYQKNNYDGFEGIQVDTDVTFLRIGFSLSGDSGVYGLFEYIKEEMGFAGFNADDNGYGLHVGFRSQSDDSLSFVGQVGYLDVGGFGTGIEFLVGADYALNPTTGLFADYRNTSEEDDSGAKATFANIRVGVRFKLGG